MAKKQKKKKFYTPPPQKEEPFDEISPAVYADDILMEEQKEKERWRQEQEEQEEAEWREGSEYCNGYYEG